MMADWIVSAFEVNASQQRRAAKVNKKSTKTEILRRSQASDSEGEDNVLSFTARKRVGSGSLNASSLTASGINTSGSSLALASPSTAQTSPPSPAATTLPNSYVNSMQLDTMQPGSAAVKGRQGSSNGPAFVDAAAILRRRREDAVYGLSESAVVSDDDAEPGKE